MQGMAPEKTADYDESLLNKQDMKESEGKVSGLEIPLDDSWGLSARQYLDRVSKMHFFRTTDYRFKRHFTQKGLSIDHNTYATIMSLISGGYLNEAANLVSEKCATATGTSKKIVGEIYYEIRTAVDQPVKITVIILAFIFPASLFVTSILWILMH